MRRFVPVTGRFLLLVLGASGASGQNAPTGIDLALARQYFEEAHQRCADDAGRLWGRDLYGPMMFADSASHTLVANRADPEGTHLQPQDGVFVGAQPDDLLAANTATDWLGMNWTMLGWPMSPDAVSRANLMVHELFHHAQEGLGFPARNAVCGHLDTLEGRVWLQLEWRALSEALRAARTALTAGWRDDTAAQAAAGAARDAALADALLFRRARRALIAGAQEPEHTLEMNEGLAEYTGVKLRGTTDAESLVAIAARLPEKAASLRTYARSFAYQTGPAWGLLLDQVADGWRKTLKLDDDLAELAGAATHAKLPADTDALLAAARTRAGSYDGAALRSTEEERARRRDEQLATWRAALVDGHRLELPLGHDMNYGYDPNNVLTLDGVGTIYPTGSLSDAWGQLSVDGGGMLLASDFHCAWVPAPAARAPGPDGRLAGEGWELHLQPGWTIVDGARAGDGKLATTALPPPR
jgi:hypothetical protein